MKIWFFLIILFAPICGVHAEVLVRCDIGLGPTVHVEVVRHQRIVDTWVYFLHMNGKIIPIFSATENSRGSSVRAKCIGKKNRAMVLTGEFMANELQGFVLTYDSRRSVPTRLDFADKLRPDWIFLGRDETVVVVPTEGRGETSRRFRLYRGSTRHNSEPAPEDTDVLPSAGAYEKVKLDRVGSAKSDGPAPSSAEK